MDVTDFQRWSATAATRLGVKMEEWQPTLTVEVPLTLSAKLEKGWQDKENPKASPFDDQGRLWVSSLASTPDIDDVGDVVLPSAFQSSIDRFGEIPLMLAYHDMRQPVGLWPKQEITKRGLELEGFISGARPDIQRLVLDDVVGKASIGFLLKEDGIKYDEDLEIFKITDMTLVEVSLVPIPANRNTDVTVMSALKSWCAEKTLERAKVREAPDAPEESHEDRTPGPPAPQFMHDGIDEMLRTTVALGVGLSGEIARSTRSGGTEPPKE
jgi:HK97 family phage prohead protease